jgi:Fe-S oxidoreductase
MSSDITQEFRELIRICEQCGTCTAACPSAYASEFNIRKLIRHLQLDLHEEKEFLSKYPWLCALCYRCKELCTEGLDIPDLVLALRELALKREEGPAKVKELLDSVKNTGSPYASSTRTKSSWASENDVSDDADTLYWVGCTTASRSPGIAKASVKAMKGIGTRVKLLENEPCCAEPLITLGLLDESKEIAKRVVEQIKDSGVKRVVTSCSGCYNTFKKSYPELLKVEIPDVEIVHISELLGEKIGEETSEGSGGESTSKSRLKLEKPLKLAYHDPCSLGRHSKVYDAPRRILESIEGVTLVETYPSKEFSGCCGGGGGLWSLNNEMANNIAESRLRRDILPLEVDGIVTCCPLCNLNFRHTAAKNKIPLKVYDLAEIVALGSI